MVILHVEMKQMEEKNWKECDEKKEKTNIKQIGKTLHRILS
jgi:hypothetical protein